MGTAKSDSSGEVVAIFRIMLKLKVLLTDFHNFGNKKLIYGQIINNTIRKGFGSSYGDSSWFRGLSCYYIQKIKCKITLNILN